MTVSTHRDGLHIIKKRLAICCFVFLLFVLAASVSAARKDIDQGFDELAHASYVAQLQSGNQTWLSLDGIVMLAGGFAISATFVDIQNDRIRNAMLGFLIAGPLVFATFGAPQSFLF